MVLKDTKPHLDRLRKLSTELNSASDAFTAELKEIESALNEISIGIALDGRVIAQGDVMPATMDEYGETVAPKCQRRTRLAYGRFNDRWRLLARTFVVHPPESEDPDWVFSEERPLVESARNMRIEAARHITEFLKDLADKAERSIGAVREVVDLSTDESPLTRRFALFTKKDVNDLGRELIGPNFAMGREQCSGGLRGVAACGKVSCTGGHEFLWVGTEPRDGNGTPATRMATGGTFPELAEAMANLMRKPKNDERSGG